MKSKVKVLSALVAGMLGVVGVTSSAHAILSKTQFKCQTTIAKEGAKFIKGVLKAHQKCIEKNLKTPGKCPGTDLTKLRAKLDAGIAKACDFSPANTAANLDLMGFTVSVCPDPDKLNGFTLADLQACIRTSHEEIIDKMIDLEYDPTIQAGPLTGTALKCQKEIAKNTGKFVSAALKALQKCRTGMVDCHFEETDTIPPKVITVCEIEGFLPKNCATAHADTAAAIAKARGKAEAAIAAKCLDPDVVAIKACEPDQTNGADTATCELDAHQKLSDNPLNSEDLDFLDFEYAEAAACGDNRKNRPAEECDGTDDSACPGQCGEPLGFFPCLCQNIPRTRVVEHASADLDNGWTGNSHDSGIVEGGGYVTDLWDCDGPGGPDTTCTVGPSCSDPPHSPCSPSPNPPANQDHGDEICAALGQGTCRATAGGQTGPHCEIDFKKRCSSDLQCQGITGDRCVFTPHGAPLPLSSAGVSVCVVNVFSEDVVGTTDLMSGDGAVRLRQVSTTYLGTDQQQPCPVCGGFCSGNASDSSPINRRLCTSNADCTLPGSVCITDLVCSYGPNKDKECRPSPPNGGPTEFFGNPSVDCPVGSQTPLGSLDILFNPATTATVTLTANVFCNRTGFNDKTCAGGPNQHAICTTDSECPGGSCNNQCFCGGGSQAPNSCNAACVGGADDGEPCIDNSECTAPGFCHNGDCRPNPSDTDSSQEGECTVGPPANRCSVHTFVACNSDADCQAGCAICDPGETCVTKSQQCFVNPVIEREGTPGVPDRTSAAVFCIPITSSAAVNQTAGVPGPGAITNPTTTIEVGF